MTRSFLLYTAEGEKINAKIVRVNIHQDIALLKIDKSFNYAFKVSTTKGLGAGDKIYTIGAPKSIELGQSVSSGIISGFRNNNNNLIQLNLAVNAGNSGGPLYDNTGKLCGIIVSKLIGNDVEGISFAIPSNLINDYLNISFK